MELISFYKEQGKKQKVLGLLRKGDGYKKLPVFQSSLQNTETRYFVL